MEILGMGIAVCMVAALVIGIALLIRGDRRPLGAMLLLGGFVCFLAIGFLATVEADAAREAGWTAAKEQREANKAGFSDPKLWRAKIEADNEQATREAGWASSGDREEARLAGFLDPKAWKDYREVKANAERVLAAMAERDVAERAAAIERERVAAVERAVAEKKAKAQSKEAAVSERSVAEWENATGLKFGDEFGRYAELFFFGGPAKNKVQEGCREDLVKSGLYVEAASKSLLGIVVKEARWRALPYAQKQEFAELANCAIAGLGYYQAGLRFHSNMTNKVLATFEIRGLKVND